MSVPQIDLQVRPAGSQDLPSLQKIAESIPDLPQWTPPVFQSLLRQDKVSLRRSILVGTIDGEIIGFGILAILFAGEDVEGEIEALAVSPEWRRRGFGGRLLQQMLAEALAAQAAAVHLEVRSGNTGAIALYRAAGFATTGRRPGYYRSPAEDAVLLALHLTAGEVQPLLPVSSKTDYGA